MAADLAQYRVTPPGSLGGRPAFRVDFTGRVAMGDATSINPAAWIEVSHPVGSPGGALLPRLTTTERNAIASPPESLLVYNVTTFQYEFYNHAGAWAAVGGVGGSNYQTIQINGVDQLVEPKANFSVEFTGADNSGVATNIGLAATLAAHTFQNATGATPGVVVSKNQSSAGVYKLISLERQATELGFFGLDANDCVTMSATTAFITASPIIPNVDGSVNLGSNTLGGFGTVFGRILKYSGASTEIDLSDNSSKNITFKSADIGTSGGFWQFVMGASTATVTGIGATFPYSGADGLKLQNTDAASTGNQKYSPILVLEGHGFRTSDSTSKAVTFGFQTQPVQASAAGGNLAFLSSTVGGTYTALTTMSNLGAWSIAGGTNSSLSVAVDAAVQVLGNFNNLHGSATNSSIVGIDRAGGSLAFLGHDTLDRLRFVASGYGAGDVLSIGWGVKYTSAAQSSDIGLPATLASFVASTVNNMPAQVEKTSFLINMAQSFKFINSGAGASEFTTPVRAMRILAPTYDFTTNTAGPCFQRLATVSISGTPNVGPNVTSFADAWALWIEAGAQLTDGTVVSNLIGPNFVANNDDFQSEIHPAGDSQALVISRNNVVFATLGLEGGGLDDFYLDVGSTPVRVLVANHDSGVRFNADVAFNGFIQNAVVANETTSASAGSHTVPALALKFLTIKDTTGTPAKVALFDV